MVEVKDSGVVVDTLPADTVIVKDFYDFIIFPGNDVLYELQNVTVWVMLKNGKYYGKDILNEYNKPNMGYESLEPFIKDGKCWIQKKAGN